MCKIGFLQLIRKHKRRWEPGCGDIETVGKVESPCREIGTFVHCRTGLIFLIPNPGFFRFVSG